MEDSCATRVILDTNHKDFNTRVAMIEKTARVRVPNNYSSIAQKN